MDNAIVRKILVVRGGALGDFILTLPVLAALRLRFPQHRLEVLGYPSIAALAVAAGLADDVSALESPRFTGLFVPNGSWSGEVSAWFSGFEWIISYLHDPGDIFRRNVARCSAAPFIAGPHRPDETLAVHAAGLLLRPLQALGIHGADPRPRLPLPATPRAPPRLALHPGSGSERKNWPEAKWAALLKLLAAQSACDLLLIGGEAEGDRCARLAAALPAGRAHIAQNLPIIELARRMQACSAFIGHDSGIAHLAAALDLPGLVLWGGTVLTTWRPQSQRLKILRDPAGLEALPVAAVWDAFHSFGWRFTVPNPNLALNLNPNEGD
jgi:ADP-heptose:LPS heptosyltransferase